MLLSQLPTATKRILSSVVLVGLSLLYAGLVGGGGAPGGGAAAAADGLGTSLVAARLRLDAARRVSSPGGAAGGWSLGSAGAAAGAAGAPSASSPRARAAPAVGAWERAHARVLVRVFPDTHNDGPGGLAHLAGTLAGASVGLRHVAVTDAAPAWAALGYTAGRPVGLPGGARRGDFVVHHEWHDAPPPPGARQLILELGDMPPRRELRARGQATKFLGSTVYTRDFLRLPRRALVRSFVEPAEWPGAPRNASAAERAKEALVLVDVECGGLADRLRDALAPRHAGLQVVVLEHDNFNDKVKYADLLRRAKVYVDAGLRGVERKAQEALLFFVAPVLEDGRNGAEEADYALPEALRFAYARSEKHGGPQNEGADAVAKVDAALADWRGAVQAAAPARALVLAQRRLHERDVARLFSLTLHVHVLVCDAPAPAPAPAPAAPAPPAPPAPGGVSAAARAGGGVLVAFALHQLAPASAQTLHVAGGADALAEKARGAWIAAGDAVGALAYADTLPRSPLCGGPGDARAALAHAPLGSADVAGALSWRALPLRADALAAWQAALRAAPARALVLVVAGARLGVLFKTLAAAPDDAPPPPPFSARLDARGGVVLVGAGGGAGADAVAEYAAPPGDWADLYRLRAQGGAPLALGVEPDEAAVDAAEALAEAGFDVRDARLQLARLAGAARTAGAPAPASAALCSHVDFRRVAAQTRHYEPLCGAGW